MRPTRSQSAFTLAELLVAIGLVALLALGINQIFASVNKLVGTGSAIAEVNASIRVAEGQLRDDAQAFARMDPSETCMVIRGRMLGDVDRDGTLDTDETAVYLSRADELADAEEGLSPYEPGSRAITVRLDEVLFLTQADADQYQTYQVFNRDEAEFPVQAQNALIYLGHALRPFPDTDFNDNANDPCDVPQRFFIPDGDFGSAAGDTNRFDPTGTFDGGEGAGNVSKEERNRYAGDWFVIRHQLLLAGGLVIDPPTAGAATREYAPLVRDREIDFRFPGVSDTSTLGGPVVTDELNPRFTRQGRTDICAQDLEDVIRWLQGMPGRTPAVNCNIADNDYQESLNCESATAFGSGVLNFSADNCDNAGFQILLNNNGADAPLWVQGGLGCNFTGGIYTGQNLATPADVVFANTIGAKSAIAGMMTRRLAESELPDLSRCITAPDDPNDPAPEDFLMDVHSTFAMQCSSLEVAWSDGTRWTPPAAQINEVIYFDVSDNQWRRGNQSVPDPEDTPVYGYGDIVWFDYLLPRELFIELAPHLIAATPDPAFPINPNDDLFPNPEVPMGEQVDRLMLPGQGDAAYDPIASFGADDLDADGSPDEYLAIFPFSQPLSEPGGGFDDETPWPKPKLLRIRMTLHDPALRLSGGRQVEVILSLDPSSF